VNTHRLLISIATLTILILSACAPAAPAATATPSGPETLTVMTTNSFSISQPVIDAFEKANNAKLVFLKSGATGETLNKAILAKNAPLADVLYGVDASFLSRALAAGIYQPYDSPMLKDIPAEFKLDPTNNALPVDFANVCMVYDKAYFKDHNLPVPQSFEDLLKPEYKGMLVDENPATSSTGLEFMLATIAHFGAEKWLDFWKQLNANGLVVVNDWNTAYYTNFSGSSGKGPQPIVVSYNSDPAAEVIFSKTPLTESPVAAIIAPGTCYRMVEFVGILKGTQHQALAQKWVDFMLGTQFQEDMPLQMYVYPVNPQAKLPDEFIKYAPQPEQPASLPPDEISKNRDAWIQSWTNTVIK
jgi:thiamine transport system substrate-binding protein